MLVQQPNKTIKIADIKDFDDTDDLDILFTFTKDLQEYFTSEEYWNDDNPSQHVLYFKFNLHMTSRDRQEAVIAIFREVLLGFVNMFQEVSAPQIVLNAPKFDEPDSGFMVTLNFVCLRAIGSKAPVQEAE